MRRVRALLLVVASLVTIQPSLVGQEHQNILPQALSRQEWLSHGRTLAGTNSALLRQGAIQQKLRLRRTRTATSVAAGIVGTWISLGPLPLPSDASGIGSQDYGWVTGRATAVAIDPNDPTGNTVYVGGAYSGVWKSTNAGPLNSDPAAVTWMPLTNGESTLAIGAIAIQPQLSNPDPSHSVVLAGTGDTSSSTNGYYGMGILRSGNGGQTWTLISSDSSGAHSFAGLGFSQFALHSANPNLVVAGAGSTAEGVIEDLENPAGANQGIYYSTDSGINWQAGSVNDAGVTIDPASILSVVYNTATSQFYAAVQFHGFYSSADGVNWTRLTTQPGAGLSTAACPPQISVPGSCPIFRGRIAVVPNRAGPSGMGEMYVWYLDANNTDQGIWKSLDGGASWSPINESGITNCGDISGCGVQQDIALAAVPDGTATDIYAGAANIYKCMITDAVPDCSGTGLRSFLNLTHVYGCSDIAKVHPNQHALDFLITTSGASLLYFANDGGLYRALDGYLGLRSGTCGVPNQVDSLNYKLGPMTQFVSLSQPATDPNVLFGGTQGNGAPATAFEQSGGPWVNVNAGDNGSSAINPLNESEWFTAIPPDAASGVHLLRCGTGINCHSQDFQSNQIADSSVLGGDVGPFNLPFILDPQNPDALILGTCRIFRGATTGGSLALLSPDFENDGGGPCRGSEVNMVRTIAAGGPQDSNGFAQVIYAGTDGQGPPNAQGGHIWVSLNASNGLTTWQDRTGNINPSGFPISSIALDPSDPSGQTAYVGIMGFHTSHVWQTTDAGNSWTDYTANLPDVPVNSIAIDPGVAIYVGTDIGVFATGTGAPNWTEVGPVATESGFLPNVAVTALKIFNSGGLKRLRAATYGRGIWEWTLSTTPDFQIAVSGNSLRVLAGQTAAFTGILYSLNGYSSSVTLGCMAANTNPPQTCLANPLALVPADTGTTFVLNAADAAGDYSFNLHAAGTDPSTVTHDFPLTLHVVDFNLGAPFPQSVSVVPGNSSGPISLLVSAQGAFSGSVTLACSGLPQGASCQFQPANTVNPTSGNPVSVSMTITTLASSPLGVFQIAINATTPGGSPQTQVVSLNITGSPDYRIAIANPSLTAQINSTAVFNGSLTALNGYNSIVTVGCGPGAPPSCVVNPATFTPTNAGAAFTVAVSSSVSQAYNFSITAVGNDALAISHSATASFTALPMQSFDFTMGVNPQSGSVPAGQAASFSLSVAPATGTFPNDVSFSCGKLPALTTCSFNPMQVASGNGSSTVALTISTTAPGAPTVASASLLGLPIAVLFWLGVNPRNSRNLKALSVFLLIGSCISCGGLKGNVIGGGGSPGTPVGTYSIQVTANAVSVNHSSQITLTVTP